MSQLSAQSIARYCDVDQHGYDSRFHHAARDERGERLPMISPFVAEKTIANGMSYGLSATSYDLRSAVDVILGPHPGYVFREHLRAAPRGLAQAILPAVWTDMHKEHGVQEAFELGLTLERIAMPHNVSGRVCDKSTWARRGLSCFNTLIDPGFIGQVTLELVNLSPVPLVIRTGDPVCQIIFTWLDEPTDRAYNGKYMNAPNHPVGAILEDVASEAAA